MGGSRVKGGRIIATPVLEGKPPAAKGRKRERGNGSVRRYAAGVIPSPPEPSCWTRFGISRFGKEIPEAELPGGNEFGMTS